MSYKKYSDLEDKRPKMVENNNPLCPELTTIEQKQSYLNKHSNLCVIDIYSTKCAPCRQIAPVFNNMSIKYEGRCGFAKENVDSQLTSGVLGVPLFVFYKNGQQIDRITGADPVALERKIVSYI
jgi:thioredoxin 1